MSLFLGNEKIAFYHGNARKFLFPKSPVKTYSESDREMLLRCTPKYEGVLQPKFGKNFLLRLLMSHKLWAITGRLKNVLEFGTRVVIEETYIKPRLRKVLKLQSFNFL